MTDIRRVVYCVGHGQVTLTSAEYTAQMKRANSGWNCPVCGASAYWVGEFHDCFDPNCNGEACVDTDVCDTCGKNQYELWMESNIGA